MKFEWANNPVVSACHLVFAVLMIVWGIAYGVANYQQDQCLRAFSDLSTSTEADLASTQVRAEKNREREAALKASIAR